MDALLMMQKARIGLITAQPFFGMLALQLELVEDPKTKTCWINGRQLGYNPQWVESLTMPQLEAIAAHEVMHCALGHHLRRGSRKLEQWNDACDYPINAELKTLGFDLPGTSKLDTRFDGMYAEAIYAALTKDEEDGKNGQGGAGGQPQGNPTGQPGAGQGEQPGQASAKPEPSPTGEVRDAVDDNGQPADAAELVEQEEQWQTMVAQAAQASRAAGKLPGSVERALQTFLNPRVDWREALQRYFAARAKDDYNWSRPNRRYMPIYLPSLDSQRIGKVAVAVDLSGSIRQKDIDQFFAELSDIRDSVKPESIIILPFDTRVRGAVEITDDQPLDFKAQAGGGTAFDDPVRWLNDEGITPEVLVYLTDLDSSVFPAEPQYPVLWVTTRKERAPFGEVIKIN